MNKCKDCKYFGEEVFWADWKNDQYNIPSGYHECEFIKHVGCDITDKQFFSDGRKDKAYCIDGSDYYAAVKVGEDFGCVNW
ncbi:MAG: hypothetical protein KAR08_09755, partial [Candidatus Heimdallarchaeota archaeon]|nr:hypothetical protein [Candidatus Heimdallarchaeota archaeon]